MIMQNITSKRPPVVVILGHVDHGKTSLLDYIRKSKVAEGESGGITQHVGAYQIVQKDKTITFIDTPGHEAFSAMRARGADVADIALLVVGADDGVKPQTKEALHHIKHADIPFIVVINKIDKPGAEPMKVRTQLLEENVTLEGFGGNTPVVEVSAKTGQGIDELLDMINLVWEVEGETGKGEERDANSGVVVESYLDKQRGPSATLLVRNGALKRGDIVATSSAFGKMRILEDFLGKDIEEASASTPVLALGFDVLPGVGEKFVVEQTMDLATARVEEKMRKQRGEADILEAVEGQKIVNIIVKADAQGTLEAIHEVLRAVDNEQVALRTLYAGVGEVNESDVKLAISGHALVVAFRVGVSSSAKSFAQQKEITILSFDIIYRLVEGIRNEIQVQQEITMVETPVGKFSVIAIFRTEKTRMIVGGKVTEGEIRKGIKAHVLRGGEVIGEGKVVQLKIQDKEMNQVGKGQELGALFEGPVKLEKNDVLDLYVLERKKPV